MDEERSIGARESPAQRVAATIEAQPPVPPVNSTLAQEFSRLLVRNPQYRDGAGQSQAEPDAPAWTDLMKSGFRFAEKMISTSAFIRYFSQRQDGRHDGAVPVEDIEEQGAGLLATTDRVSRNALLGVGQSLLKASAIDGLADELVECVRHGCRFGASWNVEIVLSSTQLPATRLFIHCDDAELLLRFVCTEEQTRRLLERNVFSLKAKLNAVSARTVLVDIERESGREMPDAGLRGKA